MTTQLSPEAHARLVAELEDIRLRGRVEIAKRIEDARALGDLSENGDYHAAKDEQGKMEMRARQIEAILRDVQIVEAAQTDVVQVGSVVVIDFGGGDTDRFLVGSIEERRDDVEIVSPESPLGRALIGRRAGETVSYRVNDRDQQVVLQAIE